MITFISDVIPWSEEEFSTRAEIKLTEDADIEDVLKAALKIMMIEGYDAGRLKKYEILFDEAEQRWGGNKQQ